MVGGPLGYPAHLVCLPPRCVAGSIAGSRSKYHDIEIWLSGYSRSLKLLPFKSLGEVSYSLSIVTMAVSVAVCVIFSVKKWCDLENKVRVRSRSLKMALFDRSHTSSYLPSIVTMALSCIICEI